MMSLKSVEYDTQHSTIVPRTLFCKFPEGVVHLVLVCSCAMTFDYCTVLILLLQ